MDFGYRFGVLQTNLPFSQVFGEAKGNQPFVGVP